MVKTNPDKSIIRFDMTACLETVALLLDYTEMDFFNIQLNHSRRVAYISLCIGKELKLADPEINDLYALALLHDNGVTLAGVSSFDFESVPQHCEQGEQNIALFPLSRKRTGVIKYHHENYDGTSYFKVSGNDIPLLSRIIRLADKLDTTFPLITLKNDKRKELKEFVKANSKKIFEPDVAEAFISCSEKERFWFDLSFHNVTEILNRIAPKIVYEFEWDEVFPVSETFMRIIDSKSKFTYRHSLQITKRAEVMAKFYNFDEEKKKKIKIAANLHDLGKLYISSKILEKPAGLDEEEFNEIKKHVYFTRLAIEKMPGFKEIADWASNHHEKLNGRGYPEGLKGDEIDFESRLMAVIDIYQALTENRPYRKGSSHKDTILIMSKMAEGNYIDSSILKDADDVFSELNLE